MLVDWIKYENGQWCKLESLNLEQGHFDNMSGVYIIWQEASNRRYIYVGQGFIKERLGDHRRNWKEQGIDTSTFYVTWASVYDEYKDGIELFLANILFPDFGGRFPRKPPIPVNLPFPNK